VRCAALLLLCAALAACSPGSGGESFFPLQEGRQWRYRVTTTIDDRPTQVEQLSVHNRGREELFSQSATRRHTNSGTDYWLREDESGTWRIAAQHALEREPQQDELVDGTRRYVLKKPYAVGTEWKAFTTAYVLQRRNEVPKEVRRTHKPMVMTYQIAAANEGVEVPAGRFEGCLRVLGNAAVRVYVDHQFAWRDIGLVTREWYCPGVGLVKVEREERSPSRFMLGGSVLLELTAWE
jgi:hypothetical protein